MSLNRDQQAFDRWLTTQPEPEEGCAWYALCDRPAVGTVSHPVLGDVPCCQRCVDKHDMGSRLTPF